MTSKSKIDPLNNNNTYMCNLCLPLDFKNRYIDNLTESYYKVSNLYPISYYFNLLFVYNI